METTERPSQITHKCSACKILLVNNNATSAHAQMVLHMRANHLRAKYTLACFEGCKHKVKSRVKV